MGERRFRVDRDGFEEDERSHGRALIVRNRERATQDCEIRYPNPLTLKAGDKIRPFEKESPEKWRDWKWRKDTKGNEDWISETYFKRSAPSEATIVKNHTAEEIALCIGDDVGLIYTDCGRSWFRKSDGEAGSFPAEILQ